MASRRLTDLSPAMQDYYSAFVQKCAEDPRLEGVQVLVTCTWRSGEEQDKLYAQGRTAPGSIVTDARAGQSKHNCMTANGFPCAEAFDVVPIRNGKCVWGTSGSDGALWQIIGECGISVGLKWYGSPGSPFKEFPHFQNPNV